MQTNELRRNRLRHRILIVSTVFVLSVFLAGVPRLGYATEAVPGANDAYGSGSLFADQGAHLAAKERREASASGNARLLSAILGEIAKNTDTVYEQQSAAAAEQREQQRLEEEARLAAEEAARIENLRASIANIALGFQGVPYVSGGTTPSGFDCSGLVRYCVLQACGIELPRTAASQSTVGYGVSFDELQPGDLLFWGGFGGAWHVAISLGGSSYVHAPAPGQAVSVDTFQYFTPSFARRLSL